MGKRFIPRPTVMSELKNYIMITLGLTIYAFTWKFFMEPNHFVTGGITGVGGVVYYATNIPMQYTYFAINIILIIIAIQQLGWKFCVKTVYAIAVMTLMLEFFDYCFNTVGWPTAVEVLGEEKQLEACIVGSIFIGMGIAFCFLSNGSTGGVDIIAAIVNKYKDPTSSTRNFHFCMELAFCIERANYLFWIYNCDICIWLNICCCNFTFFICINHQAFVFACMADKLDFFEVQNNIGYVFNDAVNALKFVIDSVYLNRADSGALDRTKKNATQRISY